MSSKSALEIIFPVSLIFFITWKPVHRSLTVSLVVAPRSFIVILTWISHFTMTPLHSPLPFTLVNWSILICESSFSMSHSIKPFSLIFNFFFWINVFSYSIS
jgi:hypothetical protein